MEIKMNNKSVKDIYMKPNCGYVRIRTIGGKTAMGLDAILHCFGINSHREGKSVYITGVRTRGVGRTGKLIKGTGCCHDDS